MSDRMLHHLVSAHLADFLDDWYGRPENSGTQPTEHNFALWLAGTAHRKPAHA